MLAIIANGVSPLGAQTRFTWPAVTHRDVGRYAAVDLCFMTVRTIVDSIQNANRIVRDTAPLKIGEQQIRPSPSIAEQAARCATHFSPKQDSSEDAGRVFQLFLWAGREADAQQLVAHRLAAIAADNKEARAEELGRWGSAYLAARPSRFAAADPLFQEIVQLGNAFSMEGRIAALTNLFHIAQLAGDSLRAQQAARWLVEIPATLSAAERQSPAFKRLSRQLLAAKQYLQMPGLLESLAQGTGAYLEYLRGAWRQMVGDEPLVGVPAVYGVTAPPVAGDWVFPGSSGQTQTPMSGKISVVKIISTSCLMDESGCLGDVAALRRLVARFPEVAFTIVAKTAGAFGPRAFAEPEEEARQIKQHLDALRLPVTVSVTNTRFLRLPDPDRRRIDEGVENEKAYQFGGVVTLKENDTFVIDRNGAVVYVETLGQSNEDLFGAILGALQQQPVRTHEARPQ